jgi:DNA polymerase III sliding clamp (beta) subunit (PCNA family)
MKIGRNQKIEAICSKDETRQHLCSPYLDLTNPADPRLVATDGHAMVALKVEEPDEHDATGHVSVDALKAARKRGELGYVLCNGSCALPGGATFPRPDVGTFPDWRMVMPKEEREGEHSIAFDVKLLKAIVDACGGEGNVTLHFADPNEPIRVNVHNAAIGHLAVLMPVRQ